MIPWEDMEALRRLGNRSRLCVVSNVDADLFDATAAAGTLRGDGGEDA